MSNSTQRTCLECEFYEPKYDRANCGDCLLDVYGANGVKEVKATEHCDFWMGSTISQSEDWQ